MMSLLSGFRLFKAVTSAIGWPARVKMAPFSGPDMEQIPAFREKDRITSTSPHRAVEKDDADDAWSERWRALFADPIETTLDQFARGQAPNTELTEGTSASTKDVPLATHLKALADKDAIEDAIRREADPRDMFSRGTIDTAGLVKNIRKRHRDNMEEHRREKNAMRIEREELQYKFDDEKERLHRIISGKNEAIQSRYEQGQQIRDDHFELQCKYKDLLEDNESKDNRITELMVEVEATVETCNRITKGSVEALKRADRQMEHRIACIGIKHRQELAESHGWNRTLQDRLKIARRLQPVIIFHRAQVGTVCEMHEKLVQMKKTKKEELAAKDKENEDLRTRNDHQEREIRDLKTVAKADGEVLNKTAELLSDTRKDLSKAEDKIGRDRREIESLNQCGKAWEKRYRAKDKEYMALKSEVNILRAAQRKELINAQADNESLQISIDFLEAANKRMDKELESWENGQGCNLRVSEPKNNNTRPEDNTASLVKALKAANARADGLQILVNTLQAEKRVWERQLGNAGNDYNPQVQEHVEHLESDNRELREATEKAALLKTQLIARFAEAEKEGEERLANRTRDLEFNFKQGFENLRELRDQWLLQKRGQEEQQHRQMVAENHRHEIERQGREDQLMVDFKNKEKTLQDKEDNLQSREVKLAEEVKNLHTSGQNLIKMEARAQKAEEKVSELQVAAINNANQLSLTERNLNNDIQSQMRDGQRHLDLLNEETRKIAGGSRLSDLHNELQTANCSINCFRYNLIHVGTNSETLGQWLYGADYYESDVSLLQYEGRPVLLAQLQAVKRTLERLRSLLAGSPNVEVEKALAIVMAPRGDEDATQPEEDIFGESSGNLQPTPQRNPRKRSGAPLGGPVYGDHEDHAAFDDWGGSDQGVSTGSTPEEILNRKRNLPKARRNGGPANPVPPENIDPAIRDQ